MHRVIRASIFNHRKITIMKLSQRFVRMLIMMLAGVTLTFVSCQKESSTTTQADETNFGNISSESDAEAESVFDDVFDNVLGVNGDVGIGGTGVFNRSAQDLSGNRTDSLGNACFTVTVTPLNAPNLFPVKVVIDFGTGCTGREGRTRKGKIIAIYTGRITVPGKSVITTFDGYYVNNTKVEGEHKIENQSTSNIWAYAVTVTNAKLSKPNGNFIQWNSSKVITQTEGLGTVLFPRDDVFSVSGETNGAVKRDSVYYQWSAKTIEPLIKRFSCYWIVKGKIGIGRTNTDAAVIDYGNGDCDNKATITINNVTHEITLY